MYLEKDLNYIRDLLFDVVEEVLINKRGISISQNRLYKYLEDNRCEFGFRTHIPSVGTMGTFHVQDFGVRRNLFDEYHFFYIINSMTGKRMYLSKENLSFQYTDGLFINYSHMSMLDIWDHVESKFIIKSRNKLIEKIIS